LTTPTRPPPERRRPTGAGSTSPTFFRRPRRLATRRPHPCVWVTIPTHAPKRLPARRGVTCLSVRVQHSLHRPCETFAECCHYHCFAWLTNTHRPFQGRARWRLRDCHRIVKEPRGRDRPPRPLARGRRSAVAATARTQRGVGTIRSVVPRALFVGAPPPGGDQNHRPEAGLPRIVCVCKPSGEAGGEVPRLRPDRGAEPTRPSRPGPGVG
jgi:hypothetical protein